MGGAAFRVMMRDGSHMSDYVLWAQATQLESGHPGSLRAREATTGYAREGRSRQEY